MRPYYIAGNWKMNKTAAEAAALAQELVEKLKSCPHRLLVAPSFTSIPAVAEAVKGTNIRLGAQNMASAESGAHTGEVSVLMLKDLGVDTVILGHSERRHIYGEKDELINEKVLLALRHGFEIILCVGETLDQREAGEVESVVVRQIREGLKNVGAEDIANVVIAYEPVWAIGTGKTATPEDAEAVHAVVRKTIRDLYSDSAADSIIIQYGGSVKPENVSGLMAKENIDGALVGGASLTSDMFVPIAEFQK
jgi:triosephosphate isomerase (TIM)